MKYSSTISYVFLCLLLSASGAYSGSQLDKYVDELSEKCSEMSIEITNTELTKEFEVVKGKILKYLTDNPSEVLLMERVIREGALSEIKLRDLLFLNAMMDIYQSASTDERSLHFYQELVNSPGCHQEICTAVLNKAAMLPWKQSLEANKETLNAVRAFFVEVARNSREKTQLQAIKALIGLPKGAVPAIGQEAGIEILKERVNETSNFIDAQSDLELLARVNVGRKEYLQNLVKYAYDTEVEVWIRKKYLKLLISWHEELLEELKEYGQKRGQKGVGPMKSCSGGWPIRLKW